jgi:protein SCO1/2
MRRLAGVLLLAAAVAAAHPASPHEDLASLAWQPHPGARLPLSTPFRDAHGKAVTLGRYFNGKPVVLLLEYLRCKDLCAVTLENIVGALNALPLDPGRDFQFLVISIDPRDKPADAAAAEKKYLAAYHRPGLAAGVHFLTGTAAAVKPVADAIGFRYRWDADDQEYIHPAGFILASPDGKVSRYFLGVVVKPADLLQGFADAQESKALGPLTRLLLFCHVQGVSLGRFEVPILAAFTLASIGSGIALFFIFAGIRRRRNG